MANLLNLCWEGLTLKHISDKSIILSYKLFVWMSFLFELFLALLFIGSGVLFYLFGYQPTVSYYISGPVLVVMMIGTVSVIMKFKSRN